MSELEDINHDIQALISAGEFNGSARMLKLLSDLDWYVEERTCGGCRGIGSHRRHCPRNPNYHPWLKLADDAENLGDSIGSNFPGLANRAYHISGALREEVKQRREASEYWKGF